MTQAAPRGVAQTVVRRELAVHDLADEVRLHPAGAAAAVGGNHVVEGARRAGERHQQVQQLVEGALAETGAHVSDVAQAPDGVVGAEQ